MNAPARIDAPAAGSPNRFRLRIADYLLLHEAGSFGEDKTELVDGEVLVLSPEWRPHFRIKNELLLRLARAVQAAGLPYFVESEGSIALSDTDMPRPDILLTSEPEGDGPIPRESVPLVVEIASTTIKSDLGSKGVRHAAGGIPEYWIVDVNRRVLVRMWSAQDCGYALVDESTFGQQLASATLRDLLIQTKGL